MNVAADVIVVGSGASAVHASYPLVEGGLRVLMLDVGKHDATYAPLIPPVGFTQVRRSDPAQHRYFLGDRFEGIPLRGIGAAAQLTPPRRHVVEEASDLTPLDSGDFSAVESLALGGLAATWGAVTVPFNDADLASWPIRYDDLEPHYEAVTSRIGISGACDDLEGHLGRPKHALLPPADLDANAEMIWRRYRRNRRRLMRAGLTLGRARLAVATEAYRGRGPLAYRDMEFWSDADRAVYRPVYTLEELRGRPTFSYASGMLVEAFRTVAQGTVEVTARNLSTGTREVITARRLILAAGTLGTARVVLRSLNRYGVRAPLVCNPYVYLACLNWPLVGRPVADRRHSLCQLIAYVRTGSASGELLQAQVYSYRSLLTFRLVKESPLAHPESIRLMRLVEPYLVTINVYHSDRPDPKKYVELQCELNGGGDRLHVSYEIPETVQRQHRAEQRRVRRLFRRLGCLCLKVVRPVHGASIHYAGCFPMTDREAPLTTRVTGQLRDAQSVYLADGSTIPDLPPKGLTLTLMANANRVGTHVRDDLQALKPR